MDAATIRVTARAPVTFSISISFLERIRALRLFSVTAELSRCLDHPHLSALDLFMLIGMRDGIALVYDTYCRRAAPISTLFGKDAQVTRVCQIGRRGTSASQADLRDLGALDVSASLLKSNEQEPPI